MSPGWTPLTIKTLESMKPAAVRREVPDGLLPGLYFIMQPTGKASWAVRYRAGGKPRKLTLGTYPAIDLRAARELAREALRKVAGGNDPAVEKKAARRTRAPANGDIGHVAKAFLDRYAKPNCREASWRETERILNREIIPAWESSGEQRNLRSGRRKGQLSGRSPSRQNLDRSGG